MKVLLILFFSIKCYGQTYDEWVRQKATQKKYLIEQIVAFKTYLGYATEGYSIARNGLSTIKDIKNGDFNLHDNYFKSLSAVNPEIKKYSKVASIVSMQISISKLIRNAKFKQLSDAEVKYIHQVFNTVLGECAKNLDELMQVITDSETQMRDDERIKVIDKLYGDMQDKQMFVRSFSNSAKRLSLQRRNDGYDIQIQKKLNGLK